MGVGLRPRAKPLGEQLQEANSVTDFSQSVLPEKFTVIKGNLSYDEQKEMYTVGCKKQGEPGVGEAQFDSQLKPGQTFVTQHAFSEVLKSNTLFTIEKTITKINPLSLETEDNYLELSFGNIPFNSVDQIFQGKPHLLTTTTYTVNNTGGTIGQSDSKPNLTPAARQYFESNPTPTDSNYVYCRVESDSASTQNSVDKINYQVNGQTVVAYLRRMTQVGEIVCTKEISGQYNQNAEKMKMGPGRSEYIDISTNELVQNEILNCGGADVFRMQKLTLDSGKVMRTYIEKTLSAPLR